MEVLNQASQSTLKTGISVRFVRFRLGFLARRDRSSCGAVNVWTVDDLTVPMARPVVARQGQTCPGLVTRFGADRNPASSSSLYCLLEATDQVPALYPLCQ